MTTVDERTRIYESQQNDIWEFVHEKNGYSWLRIAANKEIVGMSHTTFITQEAAIANAQLVGYQNKFASPAAIQWEQYQDATGEYRWRLLNKAGTVLNRSHEGYKTKAASQKNAWRHGEGRSTFITTPSISMHSCAHCTDNTGMLAVPAWLAALGIISFITLFFLRHTTANDLYWPNTINAVPLEREQLFTDVPAEHVLQECIHTLAKNKIMTGYQKDDGSFIFELQRLVQKQELAKIFVELRSIRLADCNTSPLNGSDWALPYLACAYNEQWRAFTNPTVQYTDFATLGDTAITMADALVLNEEKEVAARMYTALGNFAPSEFITREKLAEVLCTLPSA